MAYLTHGGYREHRPASQLKGVSVATLVGVAIFAIVAVIAISVVSSGAFTPIENHAVASAKSDRLTRPADSAIATSLAVRGGVERDESRQTTTIMRGASVPFNASSPYLNDQK